MVAVNQAEPRDSHFMCAFCRYVRPSRTLCVILKREIVNELETIEKRLEEIKSTTINVEEELEITIDYLEILRDKWFDFSIDDKAEIFQIMAKKITLGKDGKTRKDRIAVNIEWEKPWC